MLFILALLLLLNGLDDLLLDVWGWWLNRRQRQLRPIRTGAAARIAILVPCWREHAVIGQMIRHNLATVDYQDYHLFAGVYPNDPATVQTVDELSRAYPQVHTALVPHDGPTSKADCLNWAYQQVLLYEERAGVCFDLFVIHDAEDIIHPRELTRFDRLRHAFDMAQQPVLALPTPWTDWTHGVYCDDFAEWQLRHMPHRSNSGAFVPSNGVGTAFTRAALERLAAADGNRLFTPDSLTEDYSIGLRLHELGCRQLFLPLWHDGTDWHATREYFPRSWRTAVRQRTRWVTGIALQSWAKHGWRGDWPTRYWFWRDRKSLLTAPLALLCNGLTVGWLATKPWDLPDELRLLLAANLLLAGWRMAQRSACTARLYGWRTGCLTPVRSLLANTINAAAAVRAVATFTLATWRGQPLRWVKTEHQYPGRSRLSGQLRPLRQVLEQLGLRPPVAGDAECLAWVRAQDDELAVQALALWQGLPIVDTAHLSATRILPRPLLQRWRLVPVEVSDGTLKVASPDPPATELLTELARHTRLRVEHFLISERAYESLQT